MTTLTPLELDNASAVVATNETPVRRAAPPGFIQLGIAQAIPTLLHHYGLAADQLMEEAGLDPRLFLHPDNLIPVGALGRLLLLCAERAHCPHFGLLVGQLSTLASLRAVGALMQSSSTFGAAIRGMNTHLRVQNRGAVTQLDAQEGFATFFYAPYDPSGAGAIHIIDGALATAICVFRELCGSHFAPTEVLIPRRRPIDTTPYRTLFRAPVRFNQESAAIVFPDCWLTKSIPSADPAVHNALELEIVACEQTSPSGLQEELRRLLRAELVKARSSASEVAQLLSIHRRTLNRYLKAEGTAFRTVADEVRFGIARQLLEDTDLPLVEIAAALDFSEPAAFTRAFHRWSGSTPSAWRANTKVVQQLAR